MQCDGRFDGCQPYLRQSASLNAPLWRANPCSAIGRAVSQLDALSLLLRLWLFSELVGVFL